MLRRIYEIASLVSLIEFVVLGGLLAILFLSGRLDGEQLSEIAAAIASEEEETTDTEELPVEPQSTDDDIAAGPDFEARQEADQIMMLRFEKARLDTKNRQELIERSRLDLLKEKEEFEALKSKWTKQFKEQLKKEKDLGFAKALELIESLDPTQAKEQLLRSQDAVSVRFLHEMDIRKAAKVMGEFTTQQEQDKLADWLKQIREAFPASPLASLQTPQEMKDAS
jgi:hypothetical protein